MKIYHPFNGTWRKMQMDRGIVIFIEGDTEEEIYKGFLEKIHNMTPEGKFIVNKLIVRNLKGICNYKNRALRVFQNDILANNPDIIFNVFLCYDTDIFEFSAKPPVNWEDVIESLKKAGAEKIYQIKAKHSIEDWILNVINGLCSYLKLNPSLIKLNGKNGVKKIENLFRKANKIYVKGIKIKGFVSSLDLQKIMCPACIQLKVLCKQLGVICTNSQKGLQH